MTFPLFVIPRRDETAAGGGVADGAITAGRQRRDCSRLVWSRHGNDLLSIEDSRRAAAAAVVKGQIGPVLNPHGCGLVTVDALPRANSSKRATTGRHGCSGSLGSSQCIAVVSSYASRIGLHDARCLRSPWAVLSRSDQARRKQ